MRNSSKSVLLNRKKKIENQPLYHGTPANFDKFDTNISEGGATWFTADKNEILSGKAGAVQGSGQKLNIMERYIKPGVKLATPEMADKLYTDQLIAEGYRGVKYPAEKGESAEWTKLWFPNEDTTTKPISGESQKPLIAQQQPFQPQVPNSQQSLEDLAKDSKNLNEFIKKANKLGDTVDFGEEGNGIAGEVSNLRIHSVSKDSYLQKLKDVYNVTQSQGINVPNSQQLFSQTLAGQQLQPVSKGGTTRDVYDLGQAVAKVAKDPKGLQQNKEELKSVPNTPAPLEAGKDFVVTEKAQRDDKALNAFLKPLRDYHSEDFDRKNPKLMKQLDEMGLGHFKKHKLLWGDFTAARNWGLDNQGQPTLLDKGTLNADIYAHDKAPRKVINQYDKLKKERRQSRAILTAATRNTRQGR